MERCSCKLTWDIRCRCQPVDPNGKPNKYFVCCPVGLDTLKWISNTYGDDFEMLKKKFF